MTQIPQKTPVTRPRILVFGTTGQVGQALQNTLSTVGEVTTLSRAQADFSNSEALSQCVAQTAPDMIVNAVAYTTVDQAEQEPARAMQINAHAPAALAQAAQACNAWLIHYSTDYVFDGTKSTPYLETDPTHPINQYGHSKLAGEQAIQQSGCKHLILRTSWVYSAHGQNFLKVIAKRARELPELRVVDDQYGAPTSANLLASSTAYLIAALIKTNDPSVSGLYHLAAQGETSWYAYAQMIVQQLAHFHPATPLAKITPVPGSAYVTAAKRPSNSRLDTTRIQRTFGLTLPEWQQDVSHCLRTLYGAHL